MRTEIDELRDKAKWAISEFNKEAQRLYRNGRPVFPEAEHRERVRELKQERDAKLRREKEREQERLRAWGPGVSL